MDPKYSNLLVRSATGIVFVIVLTTSILWNRWSFFLLFLVISMAALNEFYSLLQKGGMQVQRITGLICGFLIYMLIGLPALDMLESTFTSGIFLLFTVPMITGLYLKQEKPFSSIALTTLGLIYTVVPLALLNIIGNNPGFNPWPVLGFIILIWIHDTGSYIAGFTLGRTKLFERISPKKTWEGSAGGFLFTCLGCLVMQRYQPMPSQADWLVIGMLVVVFGSFGDLAESMLKRSLGVKDSGNLLPGHGGALDRFDSLIFATPFIYFYLKVRGIC